MITKEGWQKLFLLSFLILGDQLLKFLAAKYFHQGGFFLFGGILGFEFFANYGAAFGLKMPTFLFYSFLALIFYFLVEKFKKELKRGDFQVIFALSLIGLGGLSNILDRIFRGYVIDYFFIFPASHFNLADGAILFGVGIVIWKEIKMKKINFTA